MTRAEWLEARKKGLGGSDASAIFGMSPWKTNVELWEEKTGRREEKNISADPYVQYGIACEPFIRSTFILDYPQYEVSHEENLSLQSEKYPQIRASLDGSLVEKETNRIGMLEIKAVFINSRADREKWKDGVPQHYFIQVLHNILVVEATFAILKARFVSDWDGDIRITERHYHFERSDHEKDITYLLEKELAFWKMVETDTRPDLILPEL